MAAQANGSDDVTWKVAKAIAAIMAAMIAAGFAMLIYLVGQAVEQGKQANQIVVNTQRIERLEAFRDTFTEKVDEHDANTTARLGPIEHRLDRLENQR